jgi:hypothetical protein
LTKLELTREESKDGNITVRSNSRIRIVKAVSGDTIAKIAQRNGANPVDVANLNGFTSITTALSAGREIKIPLEAPQKQSRRPLASKVSNIDLNQKGLCNLTVPESPALRGVRLGTTVAAVSKILGVRLDRGRTETLASISRLKNREGRLWDSTDPVFIRLINEKGVESSATKKKDYINVNVPGYSFFSMTGKGKKTLDGVSVISLYFFENRLYSMNYYYETDAFNNLTDKEFISSIAATLNLPERYWDKYGNVSCKNFDVWAFRGESRLSIQIKSRAIEDLVEKRKAEQVIKMYDDIKKKKAEELKKKLEEKGFRP